MLEEVQKHVDDVTKAEDSSANFQEEAPSMPVGLFNTFFGTTYPDLPVVKP